MKMILSVFAALAISSFAMADDHKAASETTHDTSKNPITGTVTETTKTESEMKDGAHHKKKKTISKAKTKTDGSTEMKTETEMKSE